MIDIATLNRFKIFSSEKGYRTGKKVLTTLNKNLSTQLFLPNFDKMIKNKETPAILVNQMIEFKIEDKDQMSNIKDFFNNKFFRAN